MGQVQERTTEVNLLLMIGTANKQAFTSTEKKSGAEMAPQWNFFEKKIGSTFLKRSHFTMYLFPPKILNGAILAPLFFSAHYKTAFPPNLFFCYIVIQNLV